MLDHYTKDNKTELDKNNVIDTGKVKNKSDKKLLLRFHNAKKIIKLLMMRLPLPLEPWKGLLTRLRKMKLNNFKCKMKIKLKK